MNYTKRYNLLNSDTDYKLAKTIIKYIKDYDS